VLDAQKQAIVNWWRAHHGMSTDGKLAAIAVRAKARRCEVLALWVSLLEHASANDERGNVAGVEAEDLSATLDCEVSTVSAVLSAFRDRKMILPGGMLANWAKRQPERERDTPDRSTERVRAFREKKRSETHGNATQHSETPETTGNAIEEIRGEEIRRETEEKPFSPTGVGAVSTDAFDRWWEAWWNHNAKQEARKAFAVALRSFTAEFLIEQAVADRLKWETLEQWAWRKNMHPATWLRGKRWEDQPPSNGTGTKPKKESRTAMLDRIFEEES
jgi:hypothetical protein